MATRIDEFVAYLLEQIGSIYVWGAQGQIVPGESWIRRMETSEKNSDRAIALYRKRLVERRGEIRAFDCSGLGMYWFQNTKKWCSDMSSATMYGSCAKITLSALIRGDMVFRHNGLRIYHVGYYIGACTINGVEYKQAVIESMGRDVGVVVREIDASGTRYWNRYGRFPLLQGESDRGRDFAAWTVKRVLRRGMSGDDVLELKTRLKSMGFLSAATKKSFGGDTYRAVKSFQKARGLAVDGIAGSKTIKALGGTLI